MPGGIEATFRILAQTANESAVPVLVAALDASQRHIQELALRALLERRSQEGHRELLLRWDTFSDHFQEIICERPGRIALALRDAVVTDDVKLMTNGFSVAVAIKEYDLIPVFQAATEQADHPLRQLAAQTLLELAEMLHDELSLPRDYRERRDPQLMRQHIVGNFELALGRTGSVVRAEVIEAFLLLAKSDNTLLRKILDDPGHPVHRSMCETLRMSPRPGVMRIILKYLERSTAPLAMLQIASQRRDIPFLRRMTKHLGTEFTEAVRRNLRRMERLGWFDDPTLLLGLNETEQMTAMRISNASGASRHEVFAIVRFLLRQGNVGGRRAAAESLAEFGGIEANELTMLALDDEDTLVRANTVRQLRDRGIPGAMARLISFVDSEEPEIREAACQALQEFSFPRYLQVFDSLDPAVRSTTGLLVRKVDPQATALLREELACSSRIRRLRGLEMTKAMGVAAELEAEIRSMLVDDDPYLRAEAARALSGVRSELAEQALRQALNDRSATVQEAAADSLRALTEPTVGGPAISLPPDIAMLFCQASVPNVSN